MNTSCDNNTPSSAVIAAKSVVAATSSSSTKNDRRKARHDSPQKSLGDFWTAFQARKPGKITSIFPRRLYDQLGLQRPADVLWPVTVSSSGVSTPSTTNSWAAIGPSTPTDEVPPTSTSSTTTSSYERAAAACRAAVARIVDECHRTNAKFTDPEFNLEQDPKLNCLRGLVRKKRCDGGEDMALMPEHTPQAVHRVDWIFEKPVFVRTQARSERASAKTDDERSEDQRSEGSEDQRSEQSEDRRWDASSVQQGKLGDCWWIAAVATIAHRSDLMDRICVARDEMCGVYGFVFVRDGQWTHVVVDDNLYLHHEDFEHKKLDASGQKARDHRQRFQRGSEALSFAHCTDANETWLPLMEKAYAKAMGDYGALSGGWHSEGMEDLTGGVSTTVVSSRVMDRNKLWSELAAGSDIERQRGEKEKGKEKGDFVFGLSVMGCGCYLANHNGLAVNHCYSVLRAVEVPTEDNSETLRLVKVRNPWGHRSEHTHMGAWHGPWSNGAKEWTPYWLAKLGHTFGDDGVFWMTYEDLLDTFGYIHRTRLFDESWTTVQRWTSLPVGWIAAYSGTHFVVDVKRPGLVVIALSQLDSRYFRGLRGQYDFTLHFVLTSSDGSVLSTVYTHNENESRSISCEVNLPVAGRYLVRPSVKAKRDRKRLTEAAVVRLCVESNPDKLRQIGQQYDRAHAKGVDVVDEDGRLEQKRVKRLRQRKARRDWQKAESKRYKAAVEAWVNLMEEKRQRQRENIDKDDNNEDNNGDNKKKDVDPGPEPKPLPEPDFFGDDDESDDDLLDDDEGDDAVAEIRKVINKKGWPFDGDKCCDDKKDKDDKDKKKDGEDDSEEPWNAVCVVGLRVFAKDPEVAIDLVKGER